MVRLEVIQQVRLHIETGRAVALRTDKKGRRCTPLRWQCVTHAVLPRTCTKGRDSTGKLNTENPLK